MARARGKRIIIRASLKQGESERINNNWRVLFLDHLAESSNVSESAATAGISPSRAYKVRREEPEFARLWPAPTEWSVLIVSAEPPPAPWLTVGGA